MRLNVREQLQQQQQQQQQQRVVYDFRKQPSFFRVARGPAPGHPASTSGSWRSALGDVFKKLTKSRLLAVSHNKKDGSLKPDFLREGLYLLVVWLSYKA